MEPQPGCLLPLLVLALILGLGAFVGSAGTIEAVPAPMLEAVPAPMQSPNGDWAAWPLEASPAP